MFASINCVLNFACFSGGLENCMPHKGSEADFLSTNSKFFQTRGHLRFRFPDGLVRLPRVLYGIYCLNHQRQLPDGPC